MKRRQDDDDKMACGNIIQSAERAIRDSDHRSRLLNELLEGLDTSVGVSELIFRSEAPALTQEAEAELISEINRSRSEQFAHHEEGEKARPRRPTLMRGIVI